MEIFSSSCSKPREIVVHGKNSKGEKISETIVLRGFEKVSTKEVMWPPTKIKGDSDVG